MKNPTVSVLIPVYNTEKYLERCLDSVIGQTLTDIEIICVDDGSTDGSAEILKKYQACDKRIKVIQKENGGLPSARNAGLDNAKGKYIGFVDSDDYVEKNMYQRMVQVAEKNNSDIVICGANIFPNKPKASDWLYCSLSPKECRYKNFEPELLFARQDTTPFLWRNLIKRELIESKHFRLDEDIHLGEDRAFQCKIYPYAKGISIISDKLYNYYWSRPDSLMSLMNYGKFEKKVLEHSRMAERIAGYLSDRKDREDILKNFLEWSISFIYGDFIYLSRENKIKTAKRLVPVWESRSCFKYIDAIPAWEREAFQYIKTFASAHEKEYMLSIVIPIKHGSRYVEEQLRRLELLLTEEIEIIVINNGVQFEDYLRVQKFLYSHQQVRLYNTPEHISYAESLNTAIHLASGQYILFLEPQDWIISYEALQKWLDYAKDTQSQICSSLNCRKQSIMDHEKSVDYICENNMRDTNKSIFEQDYHFCIYKKSFLIEKQCFFQNASVITGYVFLCQAAVKAKIITKYKETIYIMRKMHTADWISTKKCISVLEGLKNLAEISKQTQNTALHGKVYSLLIGDRLKRMIVNNTKPYRMPPSECPNGENSQIETVELLFEIIHLADMKMLSEYGYENSDSILDVLYEVIRERQKFLGDISDRMISETKTVR